MQGKNHDKKIFFQKMPEHITDGYEGALQKTKEIIQEASPMKTSIHDHPWNPNGAHTFTGKGTASILDNVAKSKHLVLKSKSVLF